MEIMMVGGAVRDMLLGLTPKDIDFVVVDSSEDEMLSLGSRVGEHFPVFLVKGDKLSHFAKYINKEDYYEVAMARQERSTGTNHQDFETITNNVTLEEDLYRRDLTINSIAMNWHGKIIDPYNGQEDIFNKVLRHTSDAFSEDPLRVLRLARFRARFGREWKIQPETKLIVNKTANNLYTISKERIWKEVERALMETEPRTFFDTLLECRSLYKFSPDMAKQVLCKEGSKFHRESSVYEHTMMMLDLATKTNESLTVRVAILMHDIAKPDCYQEFGNSSGHDNIELVEPKYFLETPSRMKKNVLFLVDNHTKIYKTKQMSAKKIAKLLYSYKTKEILNQQLNLATYDNEGRICDEGVDKEIEYRKIIVAHDNIISYSPNDWIILEKREGRDPSGDSIKQHIHNYNINVIKTIFKKE